jgi:DNA-binding IclR family transcriptional regulator
MTRRAPIVYSAPALEKGIDILELLAEAGVPLSVRAIADRLGRSKSEIFRMIVVLLSRGYLARDEATDDLVLSNRLFELGIRTPRARELLEVALPAMRALADETAQSVHLVVLSRGETVVVAAVSGGQDVSFTLRLGYRRPLVDSTSGRLIIAFQPEAAAQRHIEASRRLMPRFDEDELHRSLSRIRRRGYELHASRDVPGITDVGCPVLDGSGVAIASLVVPYVGRTGRRADPELVLPTLRRTTALISKTLQGLPAAPPAGAGLRVRHRAKAKQAGVGPVGT